MDFYFFPLLVYCLVTFLSCANFLGAWYGKVEVGASSTGLKMWRYIARACSKAFLAENYTVRVASEEISCQEVTLFCILSRI